MQRTAIAALMLMAALQAAHAQGVGAPGATVPGGAVASAAGATPNALFNPLTLAGASGNPSAGVQASRGGIRFCVFASTSPVFDFTAPNCGSDPLEVPASVIPTTGSAGTATSNRPGAASSNVSAGSSSQTTSGGGVPNALCSPAIPSTAGSSSPSAVFGTGSFGRC